jgi:hypothetical protein
MNLPFAIGGALALVGALIHGIAGEAVVVTKLRTETLSPSPFGGPMMTKLMIRATWHITTIAFVVIGSAMAACAQAGSSRACEGVGRMAAVSYASFAALTLGLAVTQGPRGLLRTVRRHPAPLVFVSVAVLAWWGAASS